MNPKDSYQSIHVMDFELRVCGVWSAGAEESAVINKRPVPLTRNLYFTGMVDAGHWD